MVTVVAATILLCFGLIIQGWHEHRSAARRPTAPHSGIVQANVRPAVFRDAPRRVYPFSIIRGGAFSAEELINALESDPIAASHYQVFQRAHLRTVRSDFVKPVYVSYRKDDRILWTSHAIYLHEGETLLTDGSSYARARCGNRISLVPQEPVAQAEPLPDALDLPEETEAIPEPLLEAAVEFETRRAPVIGPEDFASPVSKPPGLSEVPEIFGPIDTVYRVVPVVDRRPVNPSVPTVVPTDFTGPYPLPPGYVPPPPFTFPPLTITEPVPEPAGFVLFGAAACAFVLVRIRRRHSRT
jgi:hypothetical protein